MRYLTNKEMNWSGGKRRAQGDCELPPVRLTKQQKNNKKQRQLRAKQRRRAEERRRQELVDIEKGGVSTTSSTKQLVVRYK